MSIATTSQRTPWSKGKLVGQKLPLKLKDIWAIRIRPYADVDINLQFVL